MPDFRAHACTRFRFRYSECRRCADACPHDAIDLSDEGAALRASACKDCGLCISACHTQAWASPGFDPIEILREAIQKPAWRLACEPSGCQADAVVPCLGAVGAPWLAYLARRGIALSLHGTDHCTECIHAGTGPSQLQLNLQAVQAVHRAATGDAGSAWVMPEIAPDVRAVEARQRDARKGGATASRRSLFRRLFRRGEVAARQAPQSGGAPPQAPARAIRAGAYVSSAQRELLQIVCQSAEGRAVTMTWNEALPLMQLTLQPGCTLCEACLRVCPTAAIQIVEDPGHWALTFDTDRCVACEVCLEACQPRVLDAAATFDARPDQAPVTLISRTKQRCSRCDRHFVSATPEATCRICGDDEEAFLAILG